MFGLLGEPNRLRIVLACLDGPRGVGEIAEEAGMSQSLASHHLRLLRTARLLRPERVGKSGHLRAGRRPCPRRREDHGGACLRPA